MSINKYLIILFILSSTMLLGQMERDTFIPEFQEIIYFKSDQSDISSQAHERIAHLIQKSSDLDSFRFFIHAHTDQVGSPEYNLRLSKMRMESVNKELMELGINSDKIFADYHGEEMLQEGAAEEENRRATIQLQAYKKLILLSGKIVDDSTFQGIPAHIFIKSGYYEVEGFSDENGLFNLPVPLLDTIDLEIQADGFFIETNSLLIDEGHKTKKLTIPLPKLRMGKRYLFKGMNFYGDINVILPSSEPALHNLLRFMQVNEGLCIEIAGHVNRPYQDSVSIKSHSFELSVARAMRVKKELENIGISKKRMLAKGYGNWRMLYPNATSLEDQEKNRRVEIEILSCTMAENIKDDSVEDMEKFKLSPKNWLYDPKHVKTDITYFTNNLQLRFWLELKRMTDRGNDPTGLTYWEIVMN